VCYDVKLIAVSSSEFIKTPIMIRQEKVVRLAFRFPILWLIVSVTTVV
jgi:hypothetical protein